MPRSDPRALLLLFVALAPGCVTGGWYRERVFDPVTPEEVAQLHPGEATLEHALSALGAPIHVWEWLGDGAALAWGWRDSEHWGVGVSLPVAESASASFSYDDLASDMPGAVLFFGPDERLVEVRQGKLREIEDSTRRVRPAAPAESDAGGP